MRNEWLGDNRKGLAIVRVSSLRQEGNTSHDTQEIEIRDYCEEHGIKLIDVVKITESAKDSEFRKKYTQALNRAFVDDVRHVLFYMFDREARNLIDIERNEKLVMAGVMVLHYVRDRKVIHKDSSDSDFFIRDVQAVTNKHFIRNLRAKVSDAMKKKAESGWYPSNCVPLGYIVEKLKDENGREMKRGSIVVPDPNEKNVQWVKREFELRAQGLSYEQIRLKCIEEGLVDPRLLKYYRKAAIEKRIHNCFYNGEFF